jgi:hypothetical protein
MAFNNEQRTLLKSLLKEILVKYNQQQITYNSQDNSLTVDQNTIAIPRTNPRSTMATRTTHTR